jgi:hypothetical protein
VTPKPKPPSSPSTRSAGNLDLDETLLKECEDALERVLEQQPAAGESFEAYEQRVLKVVHEIARRKLEKRLQTLADGFGDRLAIEHTMDWVGLREDNVANYRRHCPGTVTYHSLVGPLRVCRFTYRECGSRTTYVPLELAAGLMERMTLALARCLAIGYAHMPLRTCEELLCASGLRPPSRSTMDRTARDLGDYAVACNAEIEPQLRANELIPPGSQLVTLGLDRVAVPMRHGEELAGACAYAPDLRRSRPTPKPRALLRGPVQWRMDYVGTVAFFDGEKRLLGSRKYRLPGDANIVTIVDRVMADLRHALVQRPIEVAVIQDGAPELWSAMISALRQEPLVRCWTEVLDWYHVDERLTKCLDVSADAARRAAQRACWHKSLLEKKRGVHRVIRSLRAKQLDVTDDEAAQLAIHVGYLEHNKQRMHYCDYQLRGIPIGSGVTEGACKSVVNVRAKRSGQRWSQRGLTAALHLRAMHESDRFDSFWSFFSRRYRAKNIVPLGIDSPHPAY